MSDPPNSNPSNRDLLLPYVLPYVLYVLPAYLLGGAEQREWLYLARIVLVGGALAWGWSRYSFWLRPGALAGSLGLGVVAGLLGTVLWVALLGPFVADGGEAWQQEAWLLRLLVSGTLPPIFEELLLRGYVLGVAVQWDQARRAGEAAPFDQAFEQRSIRSLAGGSWTPIALGVSTLLFALGHTQPEWLAALAYGALMCGLWIVRKDLVSCMTAHAVTNVALALYIRESGHWALW